MRLQTDCPRSGIRARNGGFVALGFELAFKYRLIGLLFFADGVIGSDDGKGCSSCTKSHAAQDAEVLNNAMG
jgi:hypothetical protein